MTMNLCQAPRMFSVANLNTFCDVIADNIKRIKIIDRNYPKGPKESKRNTPRASLCTRPNVTLVNVYVGLPVTT